MGLPGCLYPSDTSLSQEGKWPQSRVGVVAKRKILAHCVPETEKKIVRLVIMLISSGKFCSTSVGQVVYTGGRPPCSKTEDDKICGEKWDT
jgi:hypothetical protein